MKRRAIGFALSVIMLSIPVCLGVALLCDPYFLIGYSKTEGIDIWNNGSYVNALLMFNFTSKGFISTNYPITVSLRMMVFNNTLLSFLRGKKNVELDILGTYAYPLKVGDLGFYQGSIALYFVRNRDFEGKSDLVFPYTGKRYYCSLFAYNNDESYPLPIYTMNVTDIEDRIPPTFNIDDTYATRAQYESNMKSISVALVSLAVAGIGVVVSGRHSEDSTRDMDQKSKTDRPAGRHR